MRTTDARSNCAAVGREMLARPSGLAYVAGSMWLGPCACACSSDTCAPQQRSIGWGERKLHSRSNPRQRHKTSCAGSAGPTTRHL